MSLDILNLLDSCDSPARLDSMISQFAGEYTMSDSNVYTLLRAVICRQKSSDSPCYPVIDKALELLGIYDDRYYYHFIKRNVQIHCASEFKGLRCVSRAFWWHTLKTSLESNDLSTDTFRFIQAPSLNGDLASSSRIVDSGFEGSGPRPTFYIWCNCTSYKGLYVSKKKWWPWIVLCSDPHDAIAFTLVPLNNNKWAFYDAHNDLYLCVDARKRGGSKGVYLSNSFCSDSEFFVTIYEYPLQKPYYILILLCKNITGQYARDLIQSIYFRVVASPD